MPSVNPQQETHKVAYTSKDGHDYSEVHGDADKNLTVKSFAEKEGDLQPNREGTTPDPFDPVLTEEEQERRGLEKDDAATHPATGSEQGKAADKPDNKQAQRPQDK